MFVCDYCREHAMDNKGVGVIRSRGACELCGFTDGCYDVHGYTMKNGYQNLVYKETKNEI